MFKITYSDNTVEELPAEFIKINGFNVEHFQKSIKQIFVPKEVKNFSGCFANGNIKIELEEGLKKIFITAYRGTTIKIPLSCQKLEFGSDISLETLFIPKNVYFCEFYGKSVKVGNGWRLEFNININKLWIDSKFIRLRKYSDLPGHINFDWIRFHPESIKIDVFECNCKQYNQPLNKNKLLISNNRTICLGQQIEGSIDPTKTTYLTKEQYLEIYGEGKCQFMPDYSNVKQSQTTTTTTKTTNQTTTTTTKTNTTTPRNHKTLY